MFKIKNKFIFSIIIITSLIIGVLSYQLFIEKDDERKTYIELIKKGGKLNNIELFLNKRIELSIGDKIETIGKESMAIVEWGDGSITRLGGNTTIIIEELNISNNNTKIQIGFRLFNGKTWSNVISFLGEDSYFKEYFKDTEAAVRGTIFNLDLDKEYLSVRDHKVTLTRSNGEIIVVNEQKPINISNFSFIDITNFIINIKDKTWENFNDKVDKELFVSLKNQIYNDFESLVDFKNLNIDSVLLNDKLKKETYNKLLKEYQKIHFIKPDDNELFKIKLEIKEKLIKLSEGENKTKLLKNSLYDLKDIINFKEYGNLEILLPIFTENKDILGDIDIKKYFKNNIIPEDLKNIFIEDFNSFIDIFDISFESVKKIDILKINDSINSIKEKSLNTLFNK